MRDTQAQATHMRVSYVHSLAWCGCLVVNLRTMCHSHAVALAPRLLLLANPPPRAPPPLSSRFSTRFDLATSVFAPLVIETESMNKAAFDIDWNHSRLPGKWILPAAGPKQAATKQAVYDLLCAHYPLIRRLFKHYACCKGGDVFNMTWLAFTGMLQQWGIASDGSEATTNTSPTSLAVSAACWATRAPPLPSL